METINLHPIASDIEEFCDRASMSLKDFGLRVMNDPTWAYQVCRKGREPKRQSVEKAQVFMQSFEAAQ